MLSEDEARALPAGTLVRVIWSGGNGPCTYEVGHWPNGETCFQSPNTPPDRNTRHDIRFVGPERYHTRVWLVNDPEAPPART